MGDKIREFLANHFEKLLLPLFGIAVIWLVLTKVVIGPNRVQMGREMYEPWGIDRTISRMAEEVKLELASEAQPRPPYASNTAQLEQLYDSAIEGLSRTTAVVIAPRSVETTSLVGREYSLPNVGVIADAAAAHMRAVAYVPMDPISDKLEYKNARTGPNDIDFVTVQGTFDVPGLIKRFEASFAGSEVKLEWRDASLAKPVFGEVRLERQTMTDSGGWGPWTVVPRSRIDHRRDLLPVADRVDQLGPGGLQVKKIQFDDPQLQADLLQPPVYQIASAREEWYPPRLYARFAKLRDEQVQQLILDERQKEIDERERLRDAQRSGGAGDALYGGYDTGGTRGRTGGRSTTTTSRTTTSRTSRTGRTGTTTTRVDPRYGTGTAGTRQETTSDLDRELKALRIPPRTDVKELKTPVVFWAIDDTVTPGQTYRYRVKVGVFNPIGGTNSFRDKNAPEKDQTLLWSTYSDVLGPIYVPRMMYLFAGDVQPAAKIIGVEVAKYHMGYWRSQNFSVRCGETIGTVVEQEKKAPRRAPGMYEDDPYMYGASPVLRADPTSPDEIDYRTGAVVVDVTSVDDWTTGRSMRQVQYFEMLYSFDGRDILRLPIGATYWPRELQVARSDIQKAMTAPVEPLRAAGTGLSGPGRGGSTPIDTALYEEMYMEEYQGLYQR